MSSLRKGLILHIPFRKEVKDVVSKRRIKVEGTSFTKNHRGEERCACLFNGRSDYVDCGNVIKDLGEFSFCFWLRIDGTPHQSQTIVLSQAERQYPPVGRVIAFYTTKSSFGFHACARSGLGAGKTSREYIQMRYKPPFGFGVWKHAAQTYDRKVFRTYVDGKVVKTAAAQGKIIGDDDPLVVGRAYCYPSKLLTTYFQGAVSDLLVFDRGLSSAEVVEIFENDVSEEMIEEETKEIDKLYSFLRKEGLTCYYEKMKSGGVKYEDLEVFVEEPKALDDFIPMLFHRVKFLKALKKERMKEKGEQELISGEYNWDGKSIQIKENFAYFDNQRFEFEKLTSKVYKIDIRGDVFVFIWDDEDEMLRVVRTKGEYEFIKRISAVAVVNNADLISGEYDWNGKSLDIMRNHVYCGNKRYSFEKVASTVYTARMKDEEKFVFSWDKEDTRLGVVQVEGDGFFERIDRKVFVNKME